MSCSLCNQDLSGALMTLPCCQNIIHALCGINSIGSQLFNGYTALCSCGSLQYTTSYDQDEPVTLPDTPVFTEDVKNCNKFRILASKASNQLKKMIREKKKIFSEQAAPHIQAIKAIKRAEVSAIRSSDAFKAYNKTQKVYKNAFNKILKDHNLNTFAYRRDLRIRLKDTSRMWRYSGFMLLRYPFRVRI